MTVATRRARVPGVVVGVLLSGLAGCAAGPTTQPVITVAAPLESVRQTPPPPAPPPAPAPEAPAAPAPVAAAPADPSEAAEAQVLALANEARAAAGLPPLTRDPDLDAVARAWSVHLATEGLELAHNPDYAEQIPAGWSASAENVGWMGPSGLTAEEVAATIHATWMDSPGHRANLLDPALTHIGVGVASSPDHGWYLTQNFAAY